MALNVFAVGTAIAIVFLAILMLMAQVIGGFGFTIALMTAFFIVAYQPLVSELKERRFAVGMGEVEREGMTWETPALKEFLWYISYNASRELEPNLEGMWYLMKSQLSTLKGMDLTGYVPDDHAILPGVNAYVAMIEPSVTHARDAHGKPVNTFAILDTKTGWLIRMEPAHIFSVKQFIDEELEHCAETGSFNMIQKEPPRLSMEGIPPGMIPYMAAQPQEGK